MIHKGNTALLGAQSSVRGLDIITAGGEVPSMAKGSPKTEFLPAIERILSADAPGSASQEEATSAGIDNERLWSWVLESASERAEKFLPDKDFLERFINTRGRQEIIEAIVQDKVGALQERFQRLLHTAPINTAQIEQIIAGLPSDGSGDAYLSSLIWKESFPTELLLGLAKQERFLGALGHRVGPKELLEHMAFVHDFSEAITTLALDYFGQEATPIAEFASFVRQYHHCHMMQHNLQRSERVSEERISLAATILCEMKDLSRENEQHAPPWAAIRYHDFYRTPRSIVFLHREMLLLLDASWDDTTSAYPAHYTVYELPLNTNLDQRWEGLPSRALRRIGQMPLSELRLDASLRMAIGTSAFDTWADKQGWKL